MWLDLGCDQTLVTFSLLSIDKPTVAWSKRKSQIHAGRYYDNIEEGARSLPISKHRTMSEYYRPLGDDFERPRSADGVRR